MRARVALFVLALAVVLPGVAAQDFVLEHDEEGWSFTFEHEDIHAEPVEEAEGQRLSWSLTMQGEDHDRLLGELRIPLERFDVERPRQVVPQVDGAYFTEVFSPSKVDEAQAQYRVLNLTVEPDGFVYRIAFPVDGDEVLLSLTRDVEPPGLEVGDVMNVTHNSFYVESFTMEPALATLWVRPADSDEEDAVEHRTQTPASKQRFPVKGLKGETDYVFFVEARDWAGNKAVSASVSFTTAALQVGPAPRILDVYPEPGAVLAEPPEAIEANFDPVAGSFGPRGVRLIVDLDEVTSSASVQGDRLRYEPPEPFAPGMHVARLELTNTEGGENHTRWEFFVEEASNGSPMGPMLVVLASVVAVGLLVHRRPPRPQPVKVV